MEEFLKISLRESHARETAIREAPVAPTPVRAWAERVVIPTYRVPPPDRNPIFLERRVYQGSSGKVYPNPFTDRLSGECAGREYEAVYLENEYLRVMILPELGGRIHIGQDKTNGYDFFYRQHVIKPALVGLLGPWISGGVEWNWPQHHRPSTHQPVNWEIEEGEDGSRTVWLSEHEPMQRMKGMVGVRLEPGRALVEARVRLYNRTPFTQTFLWWANAGVRVHDQYQAFFPPDVHYVADHARRAISSFPIARNFYYGVDYRAGVDISWYKNIPVPTSYMVTGSDYDFFGGYDHRAQAGVVHVADRFIAPGKKLWTWGSADFGRAWDRELTDEDGPYVELMAGVYTDNQPDFSWLRPLETRTFSQCWYPIQRIGPPKNANRRIAIALDEESGGLRAGVCSTEIFENARVQVATPAAALLDARVTLRPGAPYLTHIAGARLEGGSSMAVFAADGERLIDWKVEAAPAEDRPPSIATEPAPPPEIALNEELYLTGVHLEQYRHATRKPESYWAEGLKRDPLDLRCNTAMGLLLLRRGLFDEAAEHFRRAVERLTERNFNPETGEPHYYLGLALLYQSWAEAAAAKPPDAALRRKGTDAAYAAFSKAAWNYEWRAAAEYQLACLECREERWDQANQGNHAKQALEWLELSLAAGEGNLKARDLRTAILRRQGKHEEALGAARATVKLDPLDLWARNELALLEERDKVEERDENAGPMQPGLVQTALDLAFDYASAGFYQEAADLMKERIAEPPTETYPMIFYALASFAQAQGERSLAVPLAARWCEAAARAKPDYCFPARLEEMLALEGALGANPSDAKGHYYLGNLYYDKKRYEDAILRWERSTALDPNFSIPWRNLGIAYFNVRHDPSRALAAYTRALAAGPGDARLIYEYDQLRKRMNFPPAERLAFLEAHPAEVEARDDLALERATLLNQTGQPALALDCLLGRRFHPWEGGEGLVPAQYVWAHRLLGVEALAGDRPQEALAHFASARNYPENLGEGKHLLTEETDLDYFSGLALARLGRDLEAREALDRAGRGEPRDAPRDAWMSYYKAIALRQTGGAADAVFEQMRRKLEADRGGPAQPDYFATSLPNLLLFADDLEQRKQIECDFAAALIDLGSGQRERAAERLRQILDRDRNHLAAQLELRLLTSNGCAANASS